MNDKQHILTMLREEFKRWEELLAGLSEGQIIAPQLPDNMSIKDVIAHLMAWQQVSIARMEAATFDREPNFPPTPPEFDLATENDVDGINAWFHATYQDRPWSSIHHSWRAGFLRFLELGEAIPEKDLLDEGRYPWMHGYALCETLLGSHEHHQEHFESLQAWLKQQHIR